MKATIMQLNNFSMMPPYTPLKKAGVFFVFIPFDMSQNEMIVITNKKRLPMINTSWSNPFLCRKFLPEIKSAVSKIKIIIAGLKYLSVSRFMN